MCIIPAIWLLALGLATYQFNFATRTRWLALLLAVFPAVLGVTLALGPGGTGDPLTDENLIHGWMLIAAVSISASFLLSIRTIAAHREETPQHAEDGRRY